MTVWAVFRFAVYRHECGGVYTTEELAREAIDELVKTEPDDHHGYEILPVILDAVPARQQPDDGYSVDLPLIEGEAIEVVAEGRFKVHA